MFFFCGALSVVMAFYYDYGCGGYGFECSRYLGQWDTRIHTRKS